MDAMRDGSTLSAEVAGGLPPDPACTETPAADARQPLEFAERCYSADQLAALLPMPKADAHKYSRGKLVIVGGSRAYPGAACLAAYASQRAGAGYTEVLCAPESVPIVRGFRPSLVVRPWGGLVADDLAPARPGKPVAYAAGSGMDASGEGFAEAKGLVNLLLKHAEAPVLVDGGGLAVLATGKARRLLRRRFLKGWPTVVTPHAGEAARLAAPLALPIADPRRLAGLLSLAYGAIVVLKGQVTYVSNGEETFCMDQGTPALAKAGTGDVLAGIIGALLAQGLDAFDSAALGTVLHAQAGCAAARRVTDICVTAEDVADALPEAIAKMPDARAVPIGFN
ncbi:MAG: NAD(P)H-hydrate dehydratase [Eggerthellaceae bacterium]|nr:NAD(P)H-hydrate dehydratase [Eggerthellaceae bacterium]